ncbi:MAG: ABC transporter permease, partial [Oscillospiraceae bacterium]|nr:ABC transporter permease [Oscillospiraceae bacterium]
RTVYPLLAKPVSRGELLAGKYLGAVVASWSALVFFYVLWAVSSVLRGGECLSDETAPGGLHAPLRWRCGEGHEFTASPYTVLKAGHWCPTCCLTPYTWRMDLVAAKSPFHAQVWGDSHARSERFVYSLRDGRAFMEAER